MVIDQWYFVGDSVVETIGDDDDDRTVEKTEIADIEDDGTVVTATGNRYTKHGMRTSPSDPWRSIRRERLGG
jgi:hypothetical protein